MRKIQMNLPVYNPADCRLNKDMHTVKDTEKKILGCYGMVHLGVIILLTYSDFSVIKIQCRLAKVPLRMHVARDSLGNLA